MYFLALTELGIILTDDGKVIKSFSFNQPASDFVRIRSNQYDNEELISFLKGITGAIFVNDANLLKYLKKKSLDVHHMDENRINEIQLKKTQLLVDAAFAKNTADAMAKLRDFAIQLSSAKVTEISQSPDLHITQAIKALDEIDVMINGLSSRLREWYGLHFPELDNVVDGINGYIQVVLAGKRSQLGPKTYQDAGFTESKIEMLNLVQQNSKGGEISDENLKIIQSIATQILELSQIRKNLETHVENEMNRIAPNLTAILGASVGARILSKAGSLRKLATLPASTIQVLGAEKALFRALKTGTQPPKHGILFQHPVVHAAPRWQRGKMARAIASKAAIAARVDVYGGGLNKTLLEKLNVRVNEIGQKYKQPTQKPPQPPRQHQKQSKREFRADIKKRKKFGRRR